MSRPRAVLIDLGNVLVRFDHMTTCDRLAACCELSPKEIHTRLFASGLEQGFDLGRVGEEEFALQALEALGANRISPKELLEAWAQIFTREEQNIALLAPLAEQAQLILLSNTNPTHFREAARLVPELRFFHGQVLSFEEDCRKPQAEIFRLALERAGVDASQACFVDDGAEHVAAARVLGIDAIHHLPGSSMREALEKRGLKFPTGSPD